MTDRELLELAAKAAGVPLADWHAGGKMFVVLDFRADWPRSLFAPLTDDGDALRLAAKLRLDIICTETDVEAIAAIAAHIQINEHSVHAPYAVEPISGDPCAATRRAIVRAAAEMGRNTPR